MGFDKSLLKLNDNNFLLSRTITTLNPLFSDILLITNDRKKFTKEFTDNLITKPNFVEDHYPKLGPLGGICTALESTSDSEIFIMAGDLAFPNPLLISKMASLSHQYDIVLCKQDDKLEPLFGFYSRKCLPIFQKQLQEKNLKIRTNFSKFSVFYLNVGKEFEEFFVNLNYPEDLTLLS